MPAAKGHGNEQDTTGVLWPSSKHQTPTEGAGDLKQCGGDAENTSAVGTLSGRVPAFQGRAGKRCKDHFSKRSWPHPTWGSLLTPSPLRHGPPGSCGLTSQPLTSGSFRGARTEETGTELATALLESRLFPEEGGQTEPTPTPAPASRSPGPIWTPGCPRRPEVPRSGRGSITEPGFWATFPGAEPALGTATPTPARASASPSVSAPSLAERAGTHRDTQTRSARHWPLSPKVSLRSQLPVSVNVASSGSRRGSSQDATSGVGTCQRDRRPATLARPGLLGPSQQKCHRRGG